MAKDVKINGEEYEGARQIEVPLADGSGTAQFYETGDISEVVTDWLDEHISNPSNPSIDTTLTVEGAAADAKAVGDRLRPPRRTVKLSVPEGYILDSGDWGSNLNHCGVYRSTLVRYRVEGATSIAVTRNAKVDDSLAIFQYREDGSKISKLSFVSDVEGSVTTTLDLDSNTKTIALRLANFTTRELPDPEVTLTVFGRSTLPEEKNPAFESNVSDTRWFRFIYKVGDLPGENGLEPVYTTGMMILPPNYTARGNPVPVILWIHGSGTYTHPATGKQNPDHTPYFNFLADCGYALIDCCGWTTRDEIAYGKSNPWPAPTACRAYQKLVELTCSSFNLDRNNLFLLSKSNGGRMASWLAGAMPNVRANCMFAPALYLRFGYAEAAYRQVLAPDMGLVGTVNTSLRWATEEACMADFINNYGSWSVAKREAFYLANEQQIMGWDPGTLHLTGATAAEMLSASAARDHGRTEWTRVGFAPTKIWYAVDDTAEISPTLCATVCAQIRNGGGEGIARPFPPGTGQHFATDSSPDAPKLASVTTPLGYTHTNVPLAYYEAWEFMEQHRI